MCVSPTLETHLRKVLRVINVCRYTHSVRTVQVTHLTSHSHRGQNMFVVAGGVGSNTHSLFTHLGGFQGFHSCAARSRPVTVVRFNPRWPPQRGTGPSPAIP